MLTTKLGAAAGRWRRQTIMVILYVMTTVLVIGLSGCIWVPWGGPHGGERDEHHDGEHHDGEGHMEAR
jgi:hypothetical protein